MDPFRSSVPNPFGQVIIPVILTDSTTSGDVNYYSWQEMRIDSSGDLIEMEGGRRGYAGGVDAAREINNRLVETPTKTWLRLRGGGADGNLIYEFISPGGGSGACTKTFITRICRVTGSGSGSGA